MPISPVPPSGTNQSSSGPGLTRGGYRRSSNALEQLHTSTSHDASQSADGHKHARISPMSASETRTPLVPLPSQPAHVPWPTDKWPRRTDRVTASREFRAQADAIFELTPAQGVTYALLVVQGGELIYERYAAGAWNPPRTSEASCATRMQSWSR